MIDGNTSRIAHDAVHQLGNGIDEVSFNFTDTDQKTQSIVAKKSQGKITVDVTGMPTVQEVNGTA